MEDKEPQEFLRLDENKAELINKRISIFESNMLMAKLINSFAVVYIDNALKVLLSAHNVDLSKNNIFTMKDKVHAAMRNKSKQRVVTALNAQLDEIMWLRGIR